MILVSGGYFVFQPTLAAETEAAWLGCWQWKTSPEVPRWGSCGGGQGSPAATKDVMMDILFVGPCLTFPVAPAPATVFLYSAL